VPDLFAEASNIVFSIGISMGYISRAGDLDDEI